MDWNELKGQWKQVKGSVRQKWSKLTDDDVEWIGGSSENFMGKLQERYGIAKDNAKRDIEEWMRTINPRRPQSA